MDQQGTAAYREARDTLVAPHRTARPRGQRVPLARRRGAVQLGGRLVRRDRPRQRRDRAVDRRGGRVRARADLRRDGRSLRPGRGLARGPRAWARATGSSSCSATRSSCGRRCSRSSSSAPSSCRRPRRSGRPTCATASTAGAPRSSSPTPPTPRSSTRCPATTCASRSVGAPTAGTTYADAYAARGRPVRDHTAATDPLLLYFTSGTTSKPKLVEHTQVTYPVGHLSTMYWIGAAAGRRAPRDQLAGLGQARVVVLLRPVDRRGDDLRLQLRPVRRGRPAGPDPPGRGRRPSARRRRCGGC